ncbi:hypothetical protein Tco_0103061 [Tanacetum coccineum]
MTWSLDTSGEWNISMISAIDVSSCSCEPYNANDVTDLLEQNERLRAEIEKVKQHYKEMFESIKITRTSTNAKTSSLLTQIEDLKAQLEGNLKVATRSSVKPKVLAPGMNSSSNTQKHEAHQKVQQTNIHVIPSTGVNASTEASGSKPRSNTKKNRILPAKTENKKKVEDHPRTNNHEMCVVNILNSVNATPTVKIVLNKGKQIWKPKGKLPENSLNRQTICQCWLSMEIYRKESRLRKT